MKYSILKWLKIQWVLKNLVFKNEKEKEVERQRLKNPAYLNHWAKRTGFKKLEIPDEIIFSDSTVEIEIGGKRYGVSIDSCTKENDGIGSYEYWGFKGYDRGIDYIEIQKVVVETVDDKPVENDFDAKYLEWYLNNGIDFHCFDFPEPDDYPDYDPY